MTTKQISPISTAFPTIPKSLGTATSRLTILIMVIPAQALIRQLYIFRCYSFSKKIMTVFIFLLTQ